MKRIFFLPLLTFILFSCSGEETPEIPPNNEQQQEEKEDPAENPDTEQGDNIFNKGIVLASQVEVNDFGANKYTRIMGGLQILDGDADFITDLTPLNTIRDVDKILAIANNENLITLNGLEGLKTVGGIQIIENDKLENIDALVNIEIVSPDDGSNLLVPLNIIRNENLLSLEGLKNSNLIDVVVAITLNPKITSLKGLENLIESSSVFIEDNENLISLLGIENLVSIDGDLSISRNASLKSLNLNALQNIERFLYIEDNNQLTTLNGLEGILEIKGDFGFENQGHAIVRNQNLRNFCAIQNTIKNSDTTKVRIRIFSNAFNPTIQEIEEGNCTE